MIPRRCHIKRIYGKSVSDDSQTTEAWIDVLRIDVFTDMQNAGGQARDVYLKWQDEPGTPGQDVSNNTRRTMRTVRITTDANPSIYFEVKAIDQMATINSDQRQIRSYRNTTANTRRRVNRTRVYKVDVTLPASGPWSTYVELLAAAQGSRDTAQYVDAELVSDFVTHQQQGFDYQAATQIMKRNTALKDILAVAPESDQVARLDPFQMIVNAQVSTNDFGYTWLLSGIISGGLAYYDAACSPVEAKPGLVGSVGLTSQRALNMLIGWLPGGTYTGLSGGLPTTTGVLAADVPWGGDIAETGVWSTCPQPIFKAAISGGYSVTRPNGATWRIGGSLTIQLVTAILNGDSYCMGATAGVGTGFSYRGVTDGRVGSGAIPSGDESTGYEGTDEAGTYSIDYASMTYVDSGGTTWRGIGFAAAVNTPPGTTRSQCTGVSVLMWPDGRPLPT